MSSKQPKSAVIAIIGKPNVGKSTLLNSIIGQKLSIVTPKAQTTRNVINGITSIGNTQLVFLDTPGIFEAKRIVDKGIVKQAWACLNCADLIIVLLDACEQINDYTIKILDRVYEKKSNTIIVINKIDVKNNHLVQILQYFVSRNTTAIFQISALHGRGVDSLLDYLVRKALPRDWAWDNEYITSLPMRFLASELTREQLFLHLHAELPYGLTVENEAWEEFNNGSIKVHQVIMVASINHKKIILGKNGSMIKSIGTNMRTQFEAIYGIKIHLFLFVKVKPKLLDNEQLFNSV